MKSIYVFFFLLLVILTGCEKSDSTGEMSQGQGGSLARFAIRNGNLYTVNSTALKLFSIDNPANPTVVTDVPINSTVVETIFIRDDTTMFIGSQDGVYIYSIKDPSSPEMLSLYSHVRSCDPVVADANYAFSTLRASGNCNNGVNELHVIDLSNLNAPSMINSYVMENPQGIGISGNLLFVCDNGLKVYDRSNVYNLQLIETFNIPAIDVIPVNNRLMVMAEDGLYQYSYSTGNLTLLSHLAVQP